jgi:hypothetical protein
VLATWNLGCGSVSNGHATDGGDGAAEARAAEIGSENGSENGSEVGSHGDAPNTPIDSLASTPDADAAADDTGPEAGSFDGASSDAETHADATTADLGTSDAPANDGDPAADGPPTADALSRCAGVVCQARDRCHAAGTCDPATGLCSNPLALDGTKCDDGNICTINDACKAGACVGSPYTCPAAPACTHVVGCVPGSGCLYNPDVNGTLCDDGNKCTQTDRCEGGKCVGSNPLPCAGPACSGSTFTTSACNPSTGACQSTSQPCPMNHACSSATTCNTSCESDTTYGCAKGFTCANGIGCVRAAVDCGANSCGVADGTAGCCALTGTCQSAGEATCSSGYIGCSTRAHCASGQLCCLILSSGGWKAYCYTGTQCPPPNGATYYQVCRTSGECVTGTCKAITSPTAQLSTCQ